jgi:holin-like protein
MATMTKGLSIVWQLTIISLISLSGDKLAHMLHLPIPGSVVGIILLFALLSLGIIKTSQISEVTNFLLKHLAFFFIPVTVSLMNYWDVFFQNGLVLFGALSISLLIAFVVFRVTSLKNGRWS